MDHVPAMAKRIWINRSGTSGQIENDAFIGFGFGHPPGGQRRNLVGLPDAQSFRAEVLRCYPDYTARQASWRANRWFDFVREAEVGDLAVMTLKSRDRLRLGVITGDYRFENGSPFHRRDVDWKDEIERPAGGTAAAVQIGKRMAFFEAVDDLATFLGAEFALRGLD